LTGRIRDIRDFIFSGFAFQKQLELNKEIEKNYLDSPLGSVEEIIEPFLDDFPDYKRRHANQMARYYEIIYLLENKLRDIIEEVLFDTHKEEWWEKSVPQPIRDEVARLQKKELDFGISLRSKKNLDFTTYGQLMEVVRENREALSTRFLSIAGLERILAVLNNLRGPIAHNAILSPDEVARLYVAVRDFFRLIRRNYATVAVTGA
jgi:hypothetical protein